VETDRRLTRAVMFVLGVCMVGVLYFRFVLEETWVQSLYYVAITVSTIGYETPPGLEDPADMLFLIGLIILGVSSGAYTVTLVVAHILEGELADRLERRKMQKTIANLEGHTIVCGIGRVGRLIARDLAEYGHTSVLIDKNEEILAEHRDDGMLVLQGDATEEAILEAAGIERAASLISAVPGDAESVFLTLTARFMNRKIRIVARGSDETSERKLRRAGANAVILPNLIGGRRMAQAVAQPNVMDFLELTLGRGRPQPAPRRDHDRPGRCLRRQEPHRLRPPPGLRPDRRRRPPPQRQDGLQPLRQHAPRERRRPHRLGRNRRPRTPQISPGLSLVALGVRPRMNRTISRMRGGRARAASSHSGNSSVPFGV
jgi:voltage-gated potassium channel